MLTMTFCHEKVGNEFSSVEALWSQFENVMAKDPEPEEGAGVESGKQSEGEGETTVDHGREEGRRGEA